MPRRQREDATRLIGQKGFEKSSDSPVGELWRNPKTGDRLLVPNETISERHFRQILRDAGYKSDEVAKIVGETKHPAKPTTLKK